MNAQLKNKREKTAILHLADGQPAVLPTGVAHGTMHALREAGLVRQVGYDPTMGNTIWQLTSDGCSAATALATE